jgi:hypothetical protein
MGSPRPWPPEPADEVAGCLDRVASRLGGKAQWVPEQPSLYEALLEMRYGWPTLAPSLVTTTGLGTRSRTTLFKLQQAR